MIYQLKKNSHVLFTKVLWAGTPFLKMKGLLGRKNLEKDEALIFPKAPSIHTYFMKFTIDIVFLDLSQKVVSCMEKVRPNRILPYVRSRYTIEMPENSVREKELLLGDLLLWEESGQTVLEYALLVAMLVFSFVVLWPPLINTFNAFIRNIIDYLVDF